MYSLRNNREWSWKLFVILWFILKLKKIVIKRIKTKCEEKKIEGVAMKFCAGAQFLGRKKKKKNSIQHQTRDASDTRHTIM